MVLQNAPAASAMRSEWTISVSTDAPDSLSDCSVASPICVSRSSAKVKSRSVETMPCWQAMTPANHPAACPASALMRSSECGFFFCGMMLEVPASPSATST